MQTPRYMHHEVSEYERREVVRTDGTSHTCPQPTVDAAVRGPGRNHHRWDGLGHTRLTSVPACFRPKLP